MLCFSDELLSTGIGYGKEVQDAGNGVFEQEAELLYCIGPCHAEGGCGGKEEGSGVYAVRNLVFEQDLSRVLCIELLCPWGGDGEGRGGRLREAHILWSHRTGN